MGNGAPHHSNNLISITARPFLTGLFFCLAPAEGAGLLFCPAAHEPHTSVYSGFSAVHAKLYSKNAKTVYRTSQRRFRRFALFQRIQYSSHTSRLYTACATPDAAQLSTAVYYNNVYKGAPTAIDPCQTVQHTADHASPAGSAPIICGSLASNAPGAPAEGSASPPVQGQPGSVSILLTPGGLQSGTLHPAGQSSSRGAAGGAEPLAALAAALFGLSPDS